tara:strand:- start:295 stop:477 length:183 start_codon:yes stop_codon:yes gene_type:complete
MRKVIVSQIAVMLFPKDEVVEVDCLQIKKFNSEFHCQQKICHQKFLRHFAEMSHQKNNLG